MKLTQIRKEIDRLDQELCKLLQRRAALALGASRRKNTIYHPKREQAILRRLIKKQTRLLSQSFIKKLYQTIFNYSRSLQGERHCLIGYKGESGDDLEKAIFKFTPRAIPFPHGTTDGLIESLRVGVIDLAIFAETDLGQHKLRGPQKIFQNKHFRVLKTFSIRISHSTNSRSIKQRSIKQRSTKKPSKFILADWKN